MTEQIQTGYFILADISGYTSYLAGVELDHAHEILTDLLETIMDRFKPFLIISKLEGDAVFAYVPTGKMPRGETLLELVEGTYLAFRDRQLAIQRRTTCACNACHNIPSLDLKFIVHHGEYLLQVVRSIIEPIGSDVNLAHRLKKLTGFSNMIMPQLPRTSGNGSMTHINADSGCTARSSPSCASAGGSLPGRATTVSMGIRRLWLKTCWTSSRSNITRWIIAPGAARPFYE